MEEATSDKKNTTRGSRKQLQKGWIRMHSDEKTKPPPVDENLEESQPRDNKTRKDPDKQIEQTVE